jgi:sigma-B regulation protein RsbU (phosphoserine phosphatase)
MAMLVILQGAGSGSSLPLEKEAIIGRQTGVDLKLEGANISRRHARIFLDANKYWVEDLGSSNGTFVNDCKLSSRMSLSTGDQIRVGPFILRFETGPEPDKESVIRAETLADLSNVDLFRKGAEEKLQAVLQIAHELALSLEPDEIIPKIMERLFALFPQADRGLFLVMENGRPVVRATRNRSQKLAAQTGALFSRSVIERVLQNNSGIVAEDVTNADMGQSICSLGVRSFICVPLKTHGGEVMGVLQLDRFSAGKSFTTEDLYLLTAISIQLSAVLENARLHKDLIQKERLERELALAREIQVGFLPKTVPPFRGKLDLHAMLYPAFEVSGDFYDYFLLDPQTLAFVIADVCGKGMPAAVFMAMVRTLLRHLAPDTRSPGQLLKLLNSAVAADNPKGLFVTMLYGICNTVTGELTIARAAHPPPILRKSHGETRHVAGSPGWLLGFTEDVPPLQEMSITLDPGDTLISYTDGITEAGVSGSDGLYGENRLLDCAGSASGSEPLERWSAKLTEDLKTFCHSDQFEDDVTLLVLRRPPMAM